ncbi:MAG: uroporphyrinogen decarboxylase [Planctomycetes bacterium]|nr:uroporphyrinogen decarboxylase [Planctomycetota bacterium]
MNETLKNSRFMKACRGEKVDATPVWLMRQAGRYMKEYMAVREGRDFLDLCFQPELACEVTVTARNKLGVDAAILFADLLPILIPMGFDLSYEKGEGPKIANPIRQASEIDRVIVHNPRETQTFVAEAVSMIRRELPSDIPLIGFAGAPFTLACYAIEGGGSRNYENAKGLMYRDPKAFHELLTRIADNVIPYLQMQIDAGAQALQVFDSWVGCLDQEDYRTHALPHTKRIIDAVKAYSPNTPIIHFGVGSATIIDDMYSAGSDVIGVDWKTPIAETWERLGAKAVQGNLDPIVLFADQETLFRKTDAILDAVAGRSGHIFNLGHGILPKTPVENVIALVDYVHERSAR